MTHHRSSSTSSSRSLTALITGAGARVGRAIAIELATHGFDLALHYHQNEKGILETLHIIESMGRQAITLKADLGDSLSRQSMIDQTLLWSNHLDMLVNNASLFEARPFEALNEEEWRRMLEVNLTAPFLLSQGLLKPLKAAQGVIFNLCDIGAERPLRGYSHYSTSKSALIGLTRALAIELAPTVRCVGISPGQVAWPPSYTAEQRERLSARIPMKESGTPEDIARLIRFLALEGRYINGAIIPVDGGLSCRY